MEIYRSTSVTSQPSGRDMQRDVSGEINIEREEEESNKISLIEEKLKFHFHFGSRRIEINLISMMLFEDF